MIALPVMSVEEAIVATADAEESPAGPLIDGCGRVIDHLRLSVTGACDLRCAYCRPAGKAGYSALARALSDAQRVDLVRLLYEAHGLKQLRITGGEPLLHPTLAPLLSAIRSAAPNLEIAMTTNGQRLAQTARVLHRAGLDRLNVSLDTLAPERYRNLTGGELRPVLEGLESAVAEGFPAPKINVVALRGVNDDELARLAQWAFRRGFEIRFLEAMPIGPAANFNRAHCLLGSEIKKRLGADFELRPLPRQAGETAARFTAVSEFGEGIIGIIAPLSESFCSQCRRIRVTADGKLFPCLLDSRHVDLSSCWRSGAFQARRAMSLVCDVVNGKKQAGPLRQDTAMVSLGG
ncbi:MAG TPA: radical SAM protein [Phycisphaerae bacterium]|nr:radical SAM protein [Phycisphaerae bacterium]